MRTSPLCYSFRIIILIILWKYLYLSDIKATWKQNGCFAIIFVNSSKPTNITELGKLSAWRFCVHYCHVVFSKFCGFFCFFSFFCRFLDPGVFIFAHKHKPLWYFCFIYFSQFCLFISLTDFWEKNKKWLIPVIVILAVIVVPLCIWCGIEDTKTEKKREQRAEKSKD